MREVHRTWFARSSSQESCGRDLVPLGNPSIHRDPETGRCYLRGVKRCGNRWACPVCARSRAIETSQEIREQLRRHREAGGEVAFVTCTLPHHAGHTCEEVRDAVSESWGYMLRGSPWGRWGERLGYVGQIRALEVTHGPNGWHWHVHALLFLEDLPDEELRDAYVRDPNLEGGEGPGGHWRPSLLCWMRNRWERRIRTWYLGDDRALERMNLSRGQYLPDGVDPLFGEPNRQHGVRVTRADEDAGEYVGKMGLFREISAIDLKRGHTEGHRTPFQILRDVCRTWTERDRRLWQAYVDATEGKAQTYTSPAVRERYARDEQLELEEEREPEDDLLLEVKTELWRLCRQMRDAFDLQIVDRAQEGGAEAVVEWLRELVAQADVGKVVGYSREQRFAYLREPVEPPGDPPPDPVDEQTNLDVGRAA